MSETVVKEELWIALAEILGPRSVSFRPLIEHFGTPEAIFAAGREELAAVAPELSAGAVSSILRGAGKTNAAGILYWCRRNGVRVLCYGEEGYPKALCSVTEPPAVLYCRGSFPDGETDFAVGVVGTRHMDEYGAGVAYKLSFELAAAGAVIVSGMADGIDGVAAAAAHSRHSRRTMCFPLSVSCIAVRSVSRNCWKHSSIPPCRPKN